MKDKVYTFTTCKFSCRHKISVTGNKYYGINKSFKSKGSYVYTDFHINAFLANFHVYIIFI